MKRCISAVIVVTALVTFCVISVNAAHWADDYYAYLTKADVLNADFVTVSETNMDNPITRSEFLSLVVSALYGKQEPVEALSTFADFASLSAPLSGYIAKAYGEGILSGVWVDGRLYIQPDIAITRQEAATILGRALELSANVSPEFSDSGLVAAWASGYVAGCEKSGLFTGYPDGSFGAENNITWAESLKIVSDSMQNGLVSPPRIISVAGNGAKGVYDGDAQLASFNAPAGVVISGDVIYVADTENNLIRKIDKGTISVYAGKIMGLDIYDTALNGLYNKTPKDSLFARPTAILPIANGFYVLDTENHVIRLIRGNTVSNFAGTGKKGLKNGAKAGAQFNNPKGFCFGEGGNIYVADTGNDAVRLISSNGTVSTVAKVPSPSGVSSHNGVLYVTSAENKIYTIKEGVTEVFAGADTGIKDDKGNIIGDYRDGVLQRAYFNNPTGIVTAADGTVYIADTGNGLVRKIKDGTVSTVAGVGKTQGIFVSPRGLWLSGNTLYVTDSFKNTVVKMEVGKR